MMMRRGIKFCAWSLGFVLLWPVPAGAQLMPLASSPWRSSDKATLSDRAVLEDLSQVEVVYLGETHDNPADHQAQLYILQELYDRNPRMAIGMEMFQRPYQAVLDQYVAGEITETDVRQQTQYDQRWGFPWTYYAPILQFAKAHQLPVLALNTPTEITHRVARKGFPALTEADRQWIPPLSEIRTDNELYRQQIRTVYQTFHQGHSVSNQFDNFFLAQVLWDETMAQTIVDYLKANPDDQVVVLAGQAHIIYGHGIPSRVARRLNEQTPFEQRSILLNPDQQTQAEESSADYFWISPEGGQATKDEG